MSNLSPARIVCAAIRTTDGKILAAPRHYDATMHALIAVMEPTIAESFKHLHGDDEGFIDQHGQYYTRDQAYIIADLNGQIRHPDACTPYLGVMQLYSEALY